MAERLLIDIGNTQTLFAIAAPSDFPLQWRIRSDHNRTHDEYAAWLGPLLGLSHLTFDQLDSVVICSVVPHILFHIRRFVRTFLPQAVCDVVGETLTQTDMPIQIHHPHELGADRLVNAIACRCLSHHQADRSAIAIDFGTATTFDILDRHGAYIGGVISSGVHATADSFVNRTVTLPFVDLDPKQALAEGLIGKSTSHAVRSGLIFGYAAMIDGLVTKIRSEPIMEQSQPMVIATGGLAPVFAPLCRTITRVEPNLLLNGLLSMLTTTKNS